MPISHSSVPPNVRAFNPVQIHCTHGHRSLHSSKAISRRVKKIIHNSNCDSSFQFFFTASKSFISFRSRSLRASALNNASSNSVMVLRNWVLESEVDEFEFWVLEGIETDWSDVFSSSASWSFRTVFSRFDTRVSYASGLEFGMVLAV